MNKLNCYITYGIVHEAHLSQILAGYKMLKDQNILNYKILFNPEIKASQMHNTIIVVKVLGKTLVYDLADGYQSFHDMEKFDKVLNEVDFYFKRSFDISKHTKLKNKNKIKPLGLNYHVSCKGNPFDLFRAKTDTPFSIMKEYLKYIRYEKRFHKNIFYPKFEI